MERIITNLVDSMVKQKYIDLTMREEYIYALTTYLEKWIVILSILTMSVFFNNTINAIIFMAAFFCLRKRTGGFHTSTFRSCYCLSLWTFGISIRIINIMSTYKFVSYIVYGTAVVIILIIGTVNHPNLDLSSKELIELAKAARLTLLVENGMMIFCMCYSQSGCAGEYMQYAVCVCAISMVISKYKKGGRECEKDIVEGIRASSKETG